MKKFIKYIYPISILLPFVALAQSFQTIFQRLQTIVASVVGLVITIAVIVFIWGLIRYIGAGANEQRRSEGRNFLIYGVIALFVMISFWGLVNLLIATFGLNTTTPSVQNLIPTY